MTGGKRSRARGKTVVPSVERWGQMAEFARSEHQLQELRERKESKMSPRENG